MNSDYLEPLNLQLSEIDMMISMYPTEEEFIITDSTALSEISDFIEGKTTYLPPQIDFILNLAFPEIKEKIELNVTLPLKYPYVSPTVFIRSPNLSREELHNLNNGILEFLSQQCKGDLVICSLVAWLSCNVAKYFKVVLGETDSINKAKEKSSFSRIWIYSHHIYNKNKRRSILQHSSDFNLTGFCLPGKPGIICVEGSTEVCHEFFQIIKQMNWKKIVLKKEELFAVNSLNSDTIRCFSDFQEISFGVRRGPSREYHMNMGEFFKYLENHNCGHIFQEIFGLEGKSSLDT